MNILFTSAGRRGYLVRYFKEEIIEGEIHVANSSKYAPAMQFADKSIVTPLIYDESYIPFLLKYCRENKIDALIPLFDIDLPILAKNKKLFENIGVTVIVSNEETINICNDKWKTYEFLSQNGFKAPTTFLSIDDALSAIEDTIISYPLIVKPRWGMGSLLVFEADNEEELVLFVKKVKRNILESYLNYEAHHNIAECVVIQEKVIGQEYGMDIINNLGGIYQSTAIKSKVAMRAGETDCAVTISNDEILQIGKRLGKTLKHIGNMDVDVFLNEKGVYVLEMNARFGGGYPFSHLAGVNLPKAYINWLQGRHINRSLLEVEPGVTGYKDISMIIG